MATMEESVVGGLRPSLAEKIESDPRLEELIMPRKWRGILQAEAKTYWV